MYIKPERMFEAFNSQYEELFQETFGNEKTAWENLMGQINKIKETNAQEDHLVLETLLAKCLNKKLENTLQTGNITPKTLEKINDAINTFYNNTISSQDESRRKKSRTHTNFGLNSRESKPIETRSYVTRAKRGTSD